MNELPFTLTLAERVLLCEEDLLTKIEQSEAVWLTVEDICHAASHWTITPGNHTADGYVTEPGSDYDLLVRELQRRFANPPYEGDHR